MKILTFGHKYELQNFDNPGHPGQVLQFIEKVPSRVSGAPEGSLDTLNDGTTNEEVLSMLIDRMNYLQRKMPCRENAMATTKLDEALLWLEKRTKDRKARGVEGKHLS